MSLWNHHSNFIHFDRHLQRTNCSHTAKLMGPILFYIFRKNMLITARPCTKDPYEKVVGNPENNSQTPRRILGSLEVCSRHSETVAAPHKNPGHVCSLGPRQFRRSLQRRHLMLPVERSFRTPGRKLKTPSLKFLPVLQQQQQQHSGFSRLPPDKLRPPFSQGPPTALQDLARAQ